MALHSLLTQAAGNRIFCFKTGEKEKIIAYFYEKEDKRFHSLHKRQGNCQENIEDQLQSISEGSEMYVVEVDGLPAAFFVRHEAQNGALICEGFHVKQECRTVDFLKQFWEIVRHIFGKPFRIGISSKNEPALKHLMKQGFQVDYKKLIDGQIFFILILNF